MRRSELNKLVEEAMGFMRESSFCLPPFAYWTPADWENKDSEYNEIRENGLGWDITDFGSDNFYKEGLLLFTLRNGNSSLKSNRKTYAEKIMIVREEQVTPYHFHWNKLEDIINRGGGNLMIRLYNSTSDGKLADTEVEINTDGRRYLAPAGIVIRLKPGESITLLQGQYHSFWGEAGYGKVLVGEVSQCNDDKNDNRFLEEKPRFPEIIEDTAARILLVNEYPKAAESEIL